MLSIVPITVLWVETTTAGAESSFWFAIMMMGLSVDDLCGVRDSQ